MMQVLNFGSLNMDHVYTVENMVSPGETISASGLKLTCGGKGLNQSIALARAGCHVYHCGCVGTDGAMLRDTLEAAGVDLRHLRPVDMANGHAIIQVNREGQNAIIIHAGSNAALTAEQVDQTLEQVAGDTLVLMQNEITSLVHIARRCQEKGLALAFNPSPMTPELLKEFPFETVRYLLINETEGREMTGREEPDEVLAALLKTYPQMKVVLTLGAQGVVYGEGNQRTFVPAFRVKAVDTTGAGDTFTGFFLQKILSGAPVEEALRTGCAASALSVTCSGAADSIPTMDQVQAFLAEHR